MSYPKEDLIGALVLKAKEGDPGEKENALSALKRLCKKYDMDLDEVLKGGEKVDHYYMEYKRGQEKLALQIVARYALTEEHHNTWHNPYHKNVVIFECTKQRYIETINAYEILSKLYIKERRKVMDAFMYGFLDKHDLYPQFQLGEKRRLDQIDDEELKARRRGSMMADDMEDADINPRVAPKALCEPE